MSSLIGWKDSHKGGHMLSMSDRLSKSFESIIVRLEEQFLNEHSDLSDIKNIVTLNKTLLKAELLFYKDVGITSEYVPTKLLFWKRDSTVDISAINIDEVKTEDTLTIDVTAEIAYLSVISFHKDVISNTYTVGITTFDVEDENNLTSSITFNESTDDLLIQLNRDPEIFNHNIVTKIKINLV